MNIWRPRIIRPLLVEQFTIVKDFSKARKIYYVYYVEEEEEKDEEERRKKIIQHPVSLFGKTLGDVQPGLPTPCLRKEQGQEHGQLWQRVPGALEFFCSCVSSPRE